MAKLDAVEADVGPYSKSARNNVLERSIINIWIGDALANPLKFIAVYSGDSFAHPEYWANNA
jgi:hypothetical protein